MEEISGEGFMNWEEQWMMIWKVGKARECEPENIYHLFNNEILQTLEIVTSEENEGKPASVIKLRNMFSSCMDTDTMEADGIPQQLLHAAAWELGGWPAVIDNWGPEK